MALEAPFAAFREFVFEQCPEKLAPHKSPKLEVVVSQCALANSVLMGEAVIVQVRSGTRVLEVGLFWLSMGQSRTVTSEVSIMDSHNLMGSDYRGSVTNALSHGQTGSVFLPLQWVRARWNGNLMTGRVCRALANEAGDALYDVELPNVIGRGGKRLHVMRTANEIEPIPEAVDV